MSTTNTTPAAGQLTSGSWRLDPARSSVEFHVRHFYGLMSVKGRFEADVASLDGETLKAEGELHAAGSHTPLDVEAIVRQVGDEFEIEATALADQRELGMTWSPMGITRAPAKLIVRGRLIRQ